MRRVQVAFPQCNEEGWWTPIILDKLDDILHERNDGKQTIIILSGIDRATRDNSVLDQIWGKISMDDINRKRIQILVMIHPQQFVQYYAKSINCITLARIQHHSDG